MNPENTLLGLAGNLLGFDVPKSMTSADLPTIPEMAHSYIDQVKEAHDQQMQRDTQIQGQGLGLLDMVGGFSKAASLVTSGTPKFMNIINRLKTSTNLSPSEREAAMSYARKLRDTNSAKYKDAPTRELMDIALKLDDLMIKSPKNRAVEEARYVVDKNLLKAMEEIQSTGMSGTIKPGTESNIKNTYRTLLELIRGRGGIEIPIR